MKYVRCGALGHRWFDTDVPSDVTSMLGVTVALACDHCSTIRIDIISRSTGQLLGRRYLKPSDYRYQFGARPSRDEFRKALIQSTQFKNRKKAKTA